MISIAQALQWARTHLALGQAEDPRAEAAILLAHVLDRPRSHLLAWPEKRLTPPEWAAYQGLVERRAQGEPVAYLTGSRGFFGLELAVSEAVLIPRAETELLVEAALARLPTPPAPPPAVADLGTGSGAIALALGKARPELRMVAVDASPEALDVARANAERLGLAHIEFRLGRWCQALAGERFDMIASNPPYIAENDPHLALGDVRFEPRMALVAGPDGLEALQAIIACAPAQLKPGGWLVLEHGYDQAQAVAGLMHAAGFLRIETLEDLLGHGRVTLGQWPQTL